jgi:hypothetical protein
MSLSQEIYQAFEDVVGASNISEDPGLLDSYLYPLSATSLHLGPYYNVYSPRGAAVVLPANTEEVQAIVKLCNLYKIGFKASSTFWSGMGYPNTEDVIQIDLRRMDHILEIDRKNCFAVIEPYVIGATLQAEAMKVGLNTHLIGAGSGCSPLASATSYLGQGPDSQFMGVGNENMLALEWVMPNGEIMRTGSLGSGLGWFCGEGPGPSVRAIVRGAQGAKGSMGVYTKCALKLYPWPGPATLPVEGTIPAYKTSLPDNFRSYTIASPSWESFANLCYRIFDTQIGYIIHRQFNKLGRNLKVAMLKILTDPHKTLNDLEELLKDPEIQKQTEEQKRDFQIVLAGMTPRDIEWQDKVLDTMLAETGSWKVASMSDPEMQKWTLLYLIRLGHKNLNLIFAGSYDGSVGIASTPDFGARHVEEWASLKNEWEKKGAMVQCGGDSMMGAVGGIGGGGNVSWENFVHFDPYDKFSVEGTYAFFDASAQYNKEHQLPPDRSRMNATARGPDGKAVSREITNQQFANSRQPAVFRYQAKIKSIIDPNNLGDSHYSTLDL